ncbi:VOC family protein [Alkalihalobacillus sp. CinArs1]|uniref:VOC family protein n=1 Tax=Alkalihalobacillus sp. CinArs1 TaxID=2995314 RepID=UPI0022DE2C98|nr:VOC family protein [Alkalihalobacillus sp. CinArs1]
MKYELSKNIGLQVKNVAEAKRFYEKVFGFKHQEHSTVNEVEFKSDHNHIFLIDGEENLGPVLELEVESLEEARNDLLKNGCKIIRWEGKGKDCYIQDPYGMTFNIWEKG